MQESAIKDGQAQQSDGPQGQQDVERIPIPPMPKYRFFSSNHMRLAHNFSARARSDPFNKEPSWVKNILAKIGSEMAKKGITPEGLFNLDETKAASLDRPKIKRFLLRMKPDLSDAELAAVFNVVDPNNSNDVECKVLAQAFKDVQGFKPPRRDKDEQTAASSILEERPPVGTCARWRNPIHRIKRFPPAVIEGHDHLEPKTRITGDHEVVSRVQAKLFQRLGSEICSPRSQENAPGGVNHMAPNYAYFGGGGDVGKFRRAYWRRLEASDGRDSACSSIIPDPGPDVRPGYHISLAKALPALATPRSRSVAGSHAASSRASPRCAPLPE